MFDENTLIRKPNRGAWIIVSQADKQEIQKHKWIEVDADFLTFNRYRCEVCRVLMLGDITAYDYYHAEINCDNAAMRRACT